MFMNRHALTKVNSPGGGNGDSQKRLSYSPERRLLANGPASRQSSLATMQSDWS
jgi:hypothetical protein